MMTNQLQIAIDVIDHGMVLFNFGDDETLQVLAAVRRNILTVATITALADWFKAAQPSAEQPDPLPAGDVVALLSVMARSTYEKIQRDTVASVNAEYLEDYGIEELLKAGLIKQCGAHSGPRDEVMLDFKVATQPQPAPSAVSGGPKLTARECRMAIELVTIHGVRSAGDVYTDTSMSGDSWTCRIGYPGGGSGHLFSLPKPFLEDDLDVMDAKEEQFYAKVREFKAQVSDYLKASRS